MMENNLLPIPEILAGEKAVDYLVWCGRYVCAEELSKQGKKENYNVWNFKSQPFTPEMITEYFGFNYNDDSTGYSILSNSKLYYFYFRKNEINICYIKNLYSTDGSREILISYLPHTLNDFTVLCKLARIELVWRGK
jgi:hypothetical protein